jgi:hypothetical protein
MEMAGLYSVSAPKTAKKAAARMAKKAYEKQMARKTRADQVSATTEKAATDSEANAGRGRFVSRPGSCGEVSGTFAATRLAVQAAVACADAHMAAFERTLKREGLAAAEAVGETAEGSYLT